MAYDLDFEKPLAELEKKISGLQRKGERLKAEERTQLQQLEQELYKRTEEIYKNLTTWQTVQISRHKDRPYSLDYLKLMCDDFFELHGDRCFGDDPAIVAGPGMLNGTRVMFLCQQKGRDLKERMHRNNGMPHPEGYRKTYRLLQQAEKFGMPVISLIDVSGASVALIDEERGQHEAIAANLYLMARLRTPMIAAIIGEGGSGGALAIGIADRILMMEHSYYTVAAPEAAASIMWRDSAFAPQAAEAMQISAKGLQPMGIIDEIVPEPLGGAHRNHNQAAENLKVALQKNLEEIKAIPIDQLVECRYQKFRKIGKFARAEDSVISQTSH
ncbi:MAG: acetyl-CoA carboxylase carboxyltransferase subunit alpha [Ktedonobacteraceae bacterium]|nr:acetyl-CoA carboxylase carboxyltransferase subunit alpha [Ktedonobacteraceae bacterium]